MLSKCKMELFNNIDIHICNDNRPSLYLQSLTDSLFISENPFIMLSCLKNVKQSPKHHPEGSVWNHTMLVIDEAAKQKNKVGDIRVFMWAALLHDIGKATTTKIRKGKLTSYDHDKAGAIMARAFLTGFADDAFISKVSAMVRWHMQILYVKNNSRFADINSMKQETNISDIALLGLCDRLGRKNIDREYEEKNITDFIKKVDDYV